MAATQSLSVGTSWTLIPGTASVVTVSPAADMHELGIRIAATNSTVTPPVAEISGHLIPDTGLLWSRGSGEGVWVRATAAGFAINFTEGA